MTVAALTEGRAQVLGDGVTDRVDLPFQFVDQDDLLVIHTDANGNDTQWTHQQVPGSWYFTGGDYATGTVFFTAADLSAGERLTVTLVSTYEQPFTLDGGEIDPDVLERAMDRTAIAVQAIAARVGRSLSVSSSLEGQLPSLEVPDLPDGYGFVRQGDRLVPALIDSAAISTAVAAAENAHDGAQVAATSAGIHAATAGNARAEAEAAALAAGEAQTAMEAARTGAEAAQADAEAAAAQAVEDAATVVGAGRIPVGSIMPWFSDVAPNQYWLIIKEQNQVFSRALFPQLLDVLAPERTVTITTNLAVVTGIGADQGLAPGMPVEGVNIPDGTTILSVDGPAQVTLSAVATGPGTTCRVFRHGNGDGSTIANLPNLAGRYLRGWDPSALINVDAGGALGITQEDAIQNITASTSSNVSRLDHVFGTADGAFGLVSGSRANYVSSNSASSTSQVGLDFDASRVVRTSENETRGKGLVGTWIIKVADGVDDEATLNAVQVVQDLAATQNNIATLETQLAATEAQLIGVAQTWQDVTGVRVLATAYHNTTGRPIFVTVRGAQGSNLQVSPDSATWVTVMAAGANQTFSHSGIVPNDWYYKVGSNFSYWSELR